MSYLVLARKYRPRTFSEVAGQEVPMRALQGAIGEDRIGHAYLFCGPRGTGKTTTARIFAKALNCERGPTPDPCGECERCLGTDAGNEPDVIEIDAASNTGVDDVRILREEVGYAPMRARFKVYIIDEVHMMSPQAFNALLKTLEEPPPHVKFLFATTELHKVIETVRSRCQIVHLSLLPENVIAAHLARVFAAEEVHADEAVTLELAKLARGSMRDGLSAAEQLLALVGKQPTVEDVRRLAGGSGADVREELLLAIESGDRRAVIDALPVSEGGESELASSLLDHLRGAMLEALKPEESKLLEADPKERERRRTRAERLGYERLSIWIEELLACRERLGTVPWHGRLVLEVTLLDLCRPETQIPLAELEARLAALESRLGGAPRNAAPPGPGPSARAVERADQAAPAPRPPTPPPTTSDVLRPTPPRPRAEVPAPVQPAPSMPAREPLPTPRPAPAAPAAKTPAASAPAARAPAASAPAAKAPAASAPAAATATAAPPRSAEPAAAPVRAPAAHAAPSAPASGAAGRPKARRKAAPRGSGAQAMWDTFLAELQEDPAVSPELAPLLGRRGRLVDHGGGRFVLQMVRLTDPEREIALTDASRAACGRALERVAGDEARVTLEDASRRQPGLNDAFTRKVADLFGGAIEDDPR